MFDKRIAIVNIKQNFKAKHPYCNFRRNADEMECITSKVVVEEEKGKRNAQRRHAQTNKSRKNLSLEDSH